MKDILKMYPFGYIFSEDKLSKYPSHYTENIIANDYYYYVDKDINYDISIKDGDFLIIHGDYVHIGISNDIPINDLADILLNSFINNRNEFLNTLDFIGGRFTIIVKSFNNVYLYPDATNGRSNYFLENRILASSHAKLIADTLDIKKEKKESVFGNVLLETPYENIKSSLPNHYVNLNTSDVTRFFPRENNPYTQMSEEKKLRLVEQFWKKQIDYYAKTSSDIIFSITGGLDSRFSLSLSKEHMHELKFFTYVLTNKIDNSTPRSKMLSKDYGVVSQILADISLQHKFFYLDDNPIVLTNEEKKILSKNTISPHKPQLTKYVYNEFGKNLLHIRGNLLEIGQVYLHRRKKVISNLDEAKKAYIKAYKPQTKDVNYLESLYDSFSKDVKFLEKPYDYHVVDMIYWELRMGRWICEVSNNHDSVFRTINPFNHRALICLSLSFNYEERRDGYMFKEIINRNFSILNFYGINNLKNLYEQSKEKDK
ncbi:hypothetical protein [Salinicoccus sp. Marseille-QA3877]